jgi:hypothetical protein
MRMNWTHITPVLAAGAAALVVAVAPMAAAEPIAAQITNASVPVANAVGPAGFHGGHYGGGYRGGYRGGFRGDRFGWAPWGWGPRGWDRRY